MSEHYRVVEDEPGKMFTIVSGTGDDEIGIGTSWGDHELADDICDLMNDAYEAGKEATCADFVKSKS